MVNTTIEHEGFSVNVQIVNGKVQIVIDDKDRAAFSSISAISIYKDDDAIRVSSDYKIREV